MRGRFSIPITSHSVCEAMKVVHRWSCCSALCSKFTEVKN